MDNKTQFNLINTNARSLRPKMSSFINCFTTMCLTLAIVSETWFADGGRLELESESLLLGNGLRLETLNREPLNSGVAYGGVAIVVRDAITRTKRYQFDNPEKFEVLPVIVRHAEIARQIFAIAAYLPPGYAVPRGKAAMQYICDLVLDIKTRHQDPLIVIAGDFNQWEVGEALAEFSDLEEVITPATRGDRKIDRIFLNWRDQVTESGCLPPLSTVVLEGLGSDSDHRVQFALSRLQKREPIRWESFTHRPFTTAGADAFKLDIRGLDWKEVLAAGSSNEKAGKLQHVLEDLMNRHFPEKTVRRKEDDLPWLDNLARKMIKKKSAVYKEEGPSQRWEALRSKLEKHLDEKKQVYLAKQRDRFIGPEASREFYKNIQAFKSPEKPKSFDVKGLCSSADDKEAADEIAEFFNRISREFKPLETCQIPFTYHRDIPLLTVEKVVDMLKTAKKAKSRVAGDIFPQLVNDCAEQLAVPLSAIYNDIITSHVWPLAWKREYVTVIPKKNIPESFSDLRNISCTQLFSKIFEGFVLRLAMEEVSLKSNQYGGVKGCATTHMVVDILQEICENAEDYRCATVLTAIDYSKAFNRVSFQHCLEAFRRKGASTPILAILASFLSNRTMSVRVGRAWSTPLPVEGGCPQGSVLGVYLFNNTTDMLEDDFMRMERRRLRLPEPPPPREEYNPTPAPPAVGLVTSSPVSHDLPLPSASLSPILAGGFAWQDKQVAYRPQLPTTLAQPVLVDPPVEAKVGTQVLVEKQVRVFKYVDDNIICEKVNFGQVPATDAGGETEKVKQAFPSQNAFRCITENAKAIGMQVNSLKTNLLCISDAINYKAKVFIVDSDGNRIDCADNLKVLGFHFSNRPTVALHVEETLKKMRKKYWFLTNLGKVGFSREELVQVYQSLVLPIADYCAPAYHSMLTDVQDQQLENAQIGALRRIFGYGKSARKLRELANLKTLRERRIELTDKFARKAAASARFCHWFPRTVGRRSGRNQETYREFFAKCDRLKNSPLFYMRRRLNGKPGKVYGERNRTYRENLVVN